MWQGMGRATRGMAACQLRNGIVVLGLLFLFAGDAAAQRFSRRPQRPARPGMNQGAPAANPASSAPAANSNDRGDGSSSAIKNLAGPNSPAPAPLKVKPDLAAEQPAEITQDVLLHVPASFFGGEVVYPAAPSMFVAVGRNGDQKDVREFWDLSTRKRLGVLRGDIKIDKPGRGHRPAYPPVQV